MPHIPRSVLAGIGILGGMALFAFWLGLFSGPGIRKVDFQVVSPSDEPDAGNDRRPILRVAVGAMISPAITTQCYEDLLKWLGDQVGRRTVFSQRKTYAEVNALLENQSIDLAFVCAGPYVDGHAKFGMEIIAVPVVDGRKDYFSYILARKDSRLVSFDDLRGKRFAFTDPHSNTGCLVPRYMLAQRKETPESFFSETFYTYSHDNSIKAVAEGMADGAAVDSLIWEFMKANDPASVANTVVIEKSPPYGIPPVVVHPALDPILKAQLKKVLLSLHRDPVALSLIKKIRIEKFDEGSDSLYQTVREMESWLKEPK